MNVAARLYRAFIKDVLVWEFFFQAVDCVKIHGNVFTDAVMRAAPVSHAMILSGQDTPAMVRSWATLYNCHWE
jgi:hypothetical protein